MALQRLGFVMNPSTAMPMPRLLVLDQDADHMTRIRDALQDSGYDVTALAAAELALEAIRKTSFDLVLTDLDIPHPGGIAFLSAAQSIDRDLVGIVMTSHAAIETAIEAMRAGAVDYVVKPFTFGTIISVLTHALEVRRLRIELTRSQNWQREHVPELKAQNAELESFSYSVSHDLRAPLRAIHGFSNMVLEHYGGALPAGALQLLAKVLANVERMTALIEHLLRFAQLSRQALLKEPVTMATLVRDVIEDLHVEAANRTVDVRIGKLPDAVGDPVLLRQVFANLLSNAFKFTRRKEQPVVEVHGRDEGTERVYYVRDNGTGFDMRHADNIFRVFHRLHTVDEFEGTGVGLSLVQRIVQRHGGRIWADATVNEGATFYFTLPNHDSADQCGGTDGTSLESKSKRANERSPYARVAQFNGEACGRSELVYRRR